jgi:hypothetical protein
MLPKPYFYNNYKNKSIIIYGLDNIILQYPTFASLPAKGILNGIVSSPYFQN